MLAANIRNDAETRLNHFKKRLQLSRMVRPHFQHRRLVGLFDDYPLRSYGIYAVYPSHKHVPAKVRAMIDFLAASFAANDWTQPRLLSKQTPQTRRPA